MTTWREGIEFWRAWAHQGGDIEPEEAKCIAAFYEALALHRGSFDDKMPEELLWRGPK